MTSGPADPSDAGEDECALNHSAIDNEDSECRNDDSAIDNEDSVLEKMTFLILGRPGHRGSMASTDGLNRFVCSRICHFLVQDSSF